MKKGLMGLLAAVMLLTAGTGALAAGRGICRSSVDCRYTDTNNDGVCDICGAAAGWRSACRRGSVDSDGDGICDNTAVCVRTIGTGHHGGGHRR